MNCINIQLNRLLQFTWHFSWATEDQWLIELLLVEVCQLPTRCRFKTIDIRRERFKNRARWIGFGCVK